MPLVLFLCLLLCLLSVTTEAEDSNTDDLFEQAADHYRNRSYSIAYQAFLPLAESGDARAQTIIALMHKYGESVPLDLEQAFAWYMRAAESGYPPAQFSVATMLRQGSGVARDSETARIWFLKAAEAGFDRADHELTTLNYEDEFNPASRAQTLWSKPWNLRLPNDIRFQFPETNSINASYRVQLGAMGSEFAARRLWQLVSEPNPDLFARHELILTSYQQGNMTIYRVQTDGFTSYQQAQEFCTSIQTRIDTGCLPLKHPD